MTRACIAATALLLIFMLGACGGGGGNPGTCFGGDEVCGRTVAAPAVDLGFARVPDSQLKSITCDGIFALNNSNKAKALASAQDALLRGANQLDRDTDKTGCDKFL